MQFRNDRWNYSRSTRYLQLYPWFSSHFGACVSPRFSTQATARTKLLQKQVEHHMLIHIKWDDSSGISKHKSISYLALFEARRAESISYLPRAAIRCTGRIPPGLGSISKWGPSFKKQWRGLIEWLMIPKGLVALVNIPRNGQGAIIY